jgi:hypothetical protein
VPASTISRTLVVLRPRVVGAKSSGPKSVLISVQKARFTSAETPGYWSSPVAQPLPCREIQKTSTSVGCVSRKALACLR